MRLRCHPFSRCSCVIGSGVEGNPSFHVLGVDWIKRILRNSNPPVPLPNSHFFHRALRWLREDLAQTYQGDITVVPHLSLSAITQLDANPNAATMAHYTREGECSTYAYVPMIRARCSIEIALRRCTNKIRQRLNALNATWLPPTPLLARQSNIGRGTPTSEDSIPPLRRDTPPSPVRYPDLTAASSTSSLPLNSHDSGPSWSPVPGLFSPSSRYPNVRTTAFAPSSLFAATAPPPKGPSRAADSPTAIDD